MAAHLSIYFFEGVDLSRLNKRYAREGLEVRSHCASMPGVPLRRRMMAVGSESGHGTAACSVVAKWYAPSLERLSLRDLLTKDIEDHGEIIHAGITPRGKHPVQTFARHPHLSRYTLKPDGPMDEITQE